MPVEDLDVILEHDKQGVILSKAEFLKLASDAKKNSDERPSRRTRWSFPGPVHGPIQDDQLVLTAVIQLQQRREAGKR